MDGYEGLGASSDEDRAGHEPSPVPGLGHTVAIPSALERACRAIAAKRRQLPVDHPKVDRVWTSYCGQVRAAFAAAWSIAPNPGLEQAIAEFKDALPGWWFTVGECQVSADASCGPTRESPHIAFVEAGNNFDGGFHADLPRPATPADALRDVMRQAAQAIEARRVETRSGSVRDIAVPNGDAP